MWKSNITNIVFFLCQRAPLHMAAGEGYKNVVEFLIEKEADISISDNAGTIIDICRAPSLVPENVTI